MHEMQFSCCCFHLNWKLTALHYAQKQVYMDFSDDQLYITSDITERSRWAARTMGPKIAIYRFTDAVSTALVMHCLMVGRIRER
jgi:hypothetical protein